MTIWCIPKLSSFTKPACVNDIWYALYGAVRSTSTLDHRSECAFQLLESIAWDRHAQPLCPHIDRWQKRCCSGGTTHNGRRGEGVPGGGERSQDRSTRDLLNSLAAVNERKEGFRSHDEAWAGLQSRPPTCRKRRGSPKCRWAIPRSCEIVYCQCEYDFDAYADMNQLQTGERTTHG
jgi:hypothetical protein